MKHRFYATLATAILTGTLLSSVAMAQETGTNIPVPPTGVSGSPTGSVSGTPTGSVSGTPAPTPPSNGNIPGHPRVNQLDQRDTRQQNRIDAGEADGQISKAQATRDQTRLDHDEAVQKNQEAKNGGHLTKAEQRKDNRKMNGSSRHIYKQRHNGKLPNKKGWK